MRDAVRITGASKRLFDRPARPPSDLPDTLRHDTFPKLLRYNAEARGSRPAYREKDLGIWQSWSWAETASEVRSFACGLAALGLRRGDKVAIVGDNRPRLYWAMAATQSLGGIPIPVYQDAVADEMAFVLDHAEVRFAVAEDQEQVDKLLAIMDRLPALERIVYEDPRGMRNYTPSFLHDYAAVQEQGRASASENPRWLDVQIQEGRGSDVAVILYTSGTTGTPKGVVLSYDNLISMSEATIGGEGIRGDEEILSYLPMAWAGDHVFSYAQAYVAGFCIACPESPETVLNDLRELGPTYFFAPPRIFENILTSVMIRMEDAGWLKRWMFRHFMAVARRCGADILDGKLVSLANRLAYKLGEILVYGPLKNALGLSRVHLGYTAGEAIGPDIFRFYRSLGINLKQLYGQTEATVFVTIQPDSNIKLDSVGVAAPGVEIRLAENGEVQYRSPGVFLEYYRNPEATAATKLPDGWVRTGDAGLFDDEGHLKILDRAKDVGHLADGTLFAPKFIENKLKFFPEIKEVVAFGDGRDFCAAMINIDAEAVGSWAERRNIPFASYGELAMRPEVAELIRGKVDAVNRDLADGELVGSRIRRFVLLSKLLDADDGELTRTQKVRRGFIGERYADVVAALYDGRDSVRLTTEVTYEDGRRDRVTTNLPVHDLALPALGLAAAAE